MNRRAATAAQVKPRRDAFRTWTDRLLWIFLYVPLLTPLPVWPNALFPFVTPKVLSFQASVEIVCGLALLSAFARRGSEKQAPWLSALPISVGAFLLLALLSAMLGTDLNRSLWGFADRQDGLVLLFHFLVWLLVLAWTFRTGNPARTMASVTRYVTVSFSVSVVAALSVLQQAAESAPATGASLAARILGSAVRPGGIMGNPAFVGPYLMFHLFFGLFLAQVAARQAGRRKILWLTALGTGEILIALAILAGRTRSVMLGAAAALLLLALRIPFARSSGRTARAAAGAVLLVAFAAGAVVWHFRSSPTISGIPLLSRLTHYSGGDDPSTRNRMLSWRAALRSFPDAPVLGIGHDNVYYALNRYYDPRRIQFTYNFRDRSESWHDKTHSFYFDLLVEKGLLGVAGLLGLVFVIARALWRLPERSVVPWAAGALIAHGLGNAVSFDGFGSLFGLFLTLAAVSAFDEPLDLWRFLSRRRQTARERRRNPGTAVRRPGRLARAAFAAAVLAAVALCVYANTEIARAVYGYARAKNAFLRDPGLGVTRYEAAFSHFSPYHAGEKLNCAYLTVNSVITNRASSRSFDAGQFVLSLSREALAAHPLDAQFYMLLNDMYNGLAMYVDKGFAAQAEAFGARALELSPMRQEAMIILGRTYLIKGESARAVEINRRMVDSFPDFGPGHWFLGVSLMADNRRESAAQEIRRALTTGYRFQNQEEMNTVKPLFSEVEFAALSAAQ